MTGSAVIDAEARATALDASRSFCVQAPAGSGKTELLTQRILKLLSRCERPEEILAFTFTRKAAFEMRQRLLESLHRASAGDFNGLSDHERLTLSLAADVLERSREKGWRLPENNQRLRITTIDAFNSYINGQLPVISGFGVRADIVEDTDPLFREAVENTMAYLESEYPVAGALAILLEYLDNSLPKVQRQLTALLEKRDQWLPHILRIRGGHADIRQQLAGYLREVIEDTLANARAHLQPYGSEIMQLLHFAAGNLAADGDDSLARHDFGPALPPAKAEYSAAWTAIAGFFLTGNGDIRKQVNVKQGFPAPSSTKNSERKALFDDRKKAVTALLDTFRGDDTIRTVLQELRYMPAPGFADGEWRLISALTEILPALAAELTVILQRQGQVDYIQAAVGALDALDNEEAVSDLALRLDYRIRHILVDEFQDTSSLQTELLAKLTAGWENGDGRTLFIVGDGMQSCYGFRNANVGLFLEARDRGIGNVSLQPLQLKVNFRSYPAVVNWVNDVFGAAFPAEDDISRGAVTYSASRSSRQDITGTGVRIRLQVADKENDIDNRGLRQNEADTVAQQVQALMTRDSEASIAILVRTRSHLDEIVPALRAAGIPWTASGIDPLTACTAVMDLLTLFRALTNRADKTALLALLRAPFVGLALADIDALDRHGDQHSLELWQCLQAFEGCPALSPDAAARLRRVMPVLARAHHDRGRQPPRQWLESIWLRLGGPAALAGAAELPAVETFFDTLEAHCSHGDITDIHDFEQKCARIYTAGETDSTARLQIMTIHNAKGLEFDYVLVPGLDRSPRADDKSLILWKEHLTPRGDNRLLLSARSPRGSDDGPNYEHIRFERNLHARMESTRLLYIAVTRAVKHAFLFATVQRGKGAISPPAGGSLLATIWEPIAALQASVEYSEVDAAPVRPEDTAVGILTRRLHSDWQHPFPQLAAALPEPDPMADESPDESHRQLLERRVGDIVHEILRTAVERRVAVDELVDESGAEKHWYSRLAAVCADDDEVSQATGFIKNTLRSCQQHPHLHWLLDANHEDSSCELPVSDYRTGIRREYIVDRTFVDNGTRWIIDYKSSALPAGQDMDTFLEQQQHQYSHQLGIYASLFREMENRPVRTALFFTSVPYFLELK